MYIHKWPDMNLGWYGVLVLVMYQLLGIYSIGNFFPKLVDF